MLPFSKREGISVDNWPDRFWKLLFGKNQRQKLRPLSACASRIGGRDENQDRCLRDDDAAVYLVVDGMGGHEGGGLASQIALDSLGDQIREACLDHPTPESLQIALHGALVQAHQEMATVANEYPECHRMGCTLAAAAILGDRVFYTHIGDSRVYLVHKGRIKRLTKDETLLQEMVSAKLISRSDAATHRWRHIVTNSLNTRGLEHEPHWKELKLSNGDQILLTSDGLTDELTDEEIAQRMRHAETPKQCVKTLIQEAIDRNAQDNVTCVVTELQREPMAD